MLNARRATLALFAASALLLGFVTPAGATPVATATFTGAITWTTGEPFAEVRSYGVGVDLVTTGGTVYRSTMMGADSAYRFEGVAPGTYAVRFREGGTAGLYSNGDDHVGRAELFTVAAGDIQVVDFQSKPAAKLSGTLTLELGGQLNFTSINAVRVDPVTMAVLSRRSLAYDSVNKRIYTFGTLIAGHYVLEVVSEHSAWLSYTYTGGVATIAESTPFFIGWGDTYEHPAVMLERRPFVAGEIEIVQPGPTTHVVNTQVVARPVNPAQPSRYFSILRSGPYILDNLVIGQQYRICVLEISPREYRRIAVPETCYGATPDNPAGTPLTATADGFSDINIRVESAAGVSIYNVYRETPEGGLEPITDVSARYWRFDEELARWVLEADTTGWYDRGGASSPIIPPGDYRIEVFYTLSGVKHKDYYPGVPRFADAEIVRVEPGKVTWIQPGMEVNPGPLQINRVNGADRFATAVELSKSQFPDASAPVVYIANGLNYPDALAAGPAAAAAGGLLLLVRPGSIPAVVQEELNRLQPSRIVIAGGPASVSVAVEEALRAFVISDELVERRLGADRYATGRAVVSAAFAPGSRPVVLVATGVNYPDALAAGPAASYYGGPVVLLNGSRTWIDPETVSLLDELDPQAIFIAGGPGSVSTAIEVALRTRYQDADSPVVRLFGTSRYETAVAVNGLFPDSDSVYIANGQGFADALAAGPIAAVTGAPVYLALTTCIPGIALRDIGDLRSRLATLVGGPGALSSRVLEGRPC